MELSVGEIVRQRDAQSPFVVLELETGYLRVVESLDHLRRFVEEFFDTLDADFQVWNSRGQALTFDRGFLDRDDPPRLVADREPSRMFVEISRFIHTSDFGTLEPRHRALLQRLCLEARDDG